MKLCQYLARSHIQNYRFQNLMRIIISTGLFETIFIRTLQESAQILEGCFQVILQTILSKPK